MPLYTFHCKECGKDFERLKSIESRFNVQCDDCGVQADITPTFPALVKMKGEGGYPSRRKFMKGSAPYTTRSTKPWLSTDPSVKTDYGFGSA